MKASDLFVKCLEAEGVKQIFGVPGEENAHFMMSLEDSPIEFVLTRHEPDHWRGRRQHGSRPADLPHRAGG